MVMVRDEFTELSKLPEITRGWRWYWSAMLAAVAFGACLAACSAEPSTTGPDTVPNLGSGQTGAAPNGGTEPIAGFGDQSAWLAGAGGGTQEGTSGGTQEGTSTGVGTLDGGSKDSETSSPQPFGDDDTCAAMAQEAENQLAPSDIIWAVDTSGSMSESMPAVVAALNEFAQTILDAGIDVHIVMLAQGVGPGFGGTVGLCIPPPLGTGDCTGSGARGSPLNDSNEPVYLHLEYPIGMTMPISVILEGYPNYAHILRQNAKKQFAIVEDGGPLFDTPQSFRDAIASWNPPVLDGEFDFNGVYCNSGACSPSCEASGVPPPTYEQLVAETDGISGNLCDGVAGFEQLLDRLAEQVIVGAELSCEWEIPEPPPGETFDKNKVNVRFTSSAGAVTDFGKVPPSQDCGPSGGWYYDDEANPFQVLVCPVTCDNIRSDSQGRIDVFFGCETKLVEIE